MPLPASCRQCTSVGPAHRCVDFTVIGGKRDHVLIVANQAIESIEQGANRSIEARGVSSCSFFTERPKRMAHQVGARETHAERRSYPSGRARTTRQATPPSVRGRRRRTGCAPTACRTPRRAFPCGWSASRKHRASIRPAASRRAGRRRITGGACARRRSAQVCPLSPHRTAFASSAPVPYDRGHGPPKAVDVCQPVEGLVPSTSPQSPAWPASMIALLALGDSVTMRDFRSFASHLVRKTGQARAAAPRCSPSPPELPLALRSSRAIVFGAPGMIFPGPS